MALKLSADGYHVSFSPCNAAHDLIVDKAGKVTLVQVKLAYKRGNGMVVNMSSNTATGRKHYREDQFGYFAIVVVEEDGVEVYFWPNTGEERAQKVIDDDVRTQTTLP